MSPRDIRAILFDKDGTLFDFHATWSRCTSVLIDEYSGGDAAVAARLARELGFDPASGQFAPQSPVIAATNLEAAACVARAVPGRAVAEIERDLSARGARAPLVSPVDLPAFLAGLRRRRLVLGVMTNDSEFSAEAQLERAGVRGFFDFVAGFDSGFGAKPAPGPVLAFARAAGLDPAAVVMVGDSVHDLMAGRAAGMRTVGVLTGPAGAADLHPHADAVLPDIGHLPAWIDA